PCLSTQMRVPPYFFSSWACDLLRLHSFPTRRSSDLPIVYDPDDGLPRALPESMLPVELPDVEDYRPVTFADDDETSEPVPPLARASDWVEVTLDLGEGPKTYRRETNTMPQWAGRGGSGLQ